MKLYIIILLATHTIVQATENVSVYNNTDGDMYIAAAYYRPIYKRIEVDLPVLPIQKLSARAVTSIQRRKQLMKDQIVIFSSDENALQFITSIQVQQSITHAMERNIEKRKKEVPLLARLTDDPLKRLNETLNEAKKSLTVLEKESKKALEKVLFCIINENKIYTIKKDDRSARFIIQASMEQPLSLLKNEQREIKHVQNQDTNQKNDKILIKENKERQSEVTLINENISVLPEEKVVPYEQQLKPEKLSMPQKEEEYAAAKIEEDKNIFIAPLQENNDKQSIIEKTWQSMAQFDASQSIIINGTGGDLQIAIVYWGIGKKTPIPHAKDIMTITSSESKMFKSPEIKFLKWRYLFYKFSPEEKWQYLSMWPIANAYIFGNDKKIVTYNYAAKAAMVTKDITVQDPVYTAVYHYTKGKGALRTTPVIEISDVESLVEVPYFFTFTQRGYRQLAIHKNRDALAVNLSENGYKNIVIKNIKLNITQQPFYHILEVDKGLIIYDNDEWNKILKDLKEPKDPIELSWLDKFVQGKLMTGLQIVREKLED